jgi:hypothetical protein
LNLEDSALLTGTVTLDEGSDIRYRTVRLAVALGLATRSPCLPERPKGSDGETKGQ